MSPEARASGFFLRWSRHLRGHERPRPSRWVAVSCGLCRLTPLLRSEADVALPEFFSLIPSLSGDQGPHLGGRPACLTRPPLATCHAHGPEASGPVPASAGLPIKTAEARRMGAEGPGSGSPNAGGCWLESRPSPDAHRRPPATTRRRARCGHDRHSGRPASAGLRPGPRLREAPVWEARGAGGCPLVCDDSFPSCDLAAGLLLLHTRPRHADLSPDSARARATCPRPRSEGPIGGHDRLRLAVAPRPISRSLRRQKSSRLSFQNYVLRGHGKRTVDPAHL